MEKKGKSVILLPGPPGELVPMFEEKVYDYLNKLQPEIILFHHCADLRTG